MQESAGLDLSLLLAAGPAAGLLLLPFLRALRGAAVALLPNVVLAFFFVLVLGLTGKVGGLALPALLFVGIGVALDDLRVFLKSYRGAVTDGREHGAAVRRALARVSRPLLASVATALGGLLLALAFSGTPTGRAGSAALLLMGLALAGDMLLLPIGLVCCRETD